MRHEEYIIGIDEAGRGPIAGPVAVGVCVISLRALRRVLRLSALPRGRDSKKLSASAREAIYQRLEILQKSGQLRFSVGFGPSTLIDRKGIVYAIRFAMAKALQRLQVDPAHSRVLLDGGLKAPAVFLRQETIIKGDEKKPVIGLASIVAKVLRDRRMVRASLRFSGYGFERHMGYGTRFHYETLRALEPCPLHRKSFLAKMRG